MPTSSAPGLEAPPHAEVVVILDFGAQYAQLIARRVREAGAFSMLVAPDISLDELKRIAPKGIILSGGPSSVLEDGAPRSRLPSVVLVNQPIRRFLSFATQSFRRVRVSRIPGPVLPIPMPSSTTVTSMSGIRIPAREAAIRTAPNWP